mgnify:CR=1 FL=1
MGIVFDMAKAPKFEVQATRNGLFAICIPSNMSSSGKGGKRYFKKKSDALDAQTGLRRRLKKHGSDAPVMEKSTKSDLTAPVATSFPVFMLDKFNPQYEQPPNLTSKLVLF